MFGVKEFNAPVPLHLAGARKSGGPMSHAKHSKVLRNVSARQAPAPGARAAAADVANASVDELMRFIENTESPLRFVPDLTDEPVRHAA